MTVVSCQFYCRLVVRTRVTIYDLVGVRTWGRKGIQNYFVITGLLTTGSRKSRKHFYAVSPALYIKRIVDAQSVLFSKIILPSSDGHFQKKVVSYRDLSFWA